MPLSDAQRERYSRHIALPEIGIEGQKKIIAAGVLIIGAGGLGSTVTLYLAGSGVGRIGIIDSDVVELSNLHRQILHTSHRLGMPKVDSARISLGATNPDIRVETYLDRLDEDNAAALIGGYDIVVDCSDNFTTRFLVNDTCVLAGRPLVSGAVLGFEGQVTTILPRKGHCYRCLFEAPPPPELVRSREEAGVIGPVPGVIGALQAAEVLKIIVGMGDLLTNRLVVYDALKATFRQVDVPRNPACPVCGDLGSRDA